MMRFLDLAVGSRFRFASTDEMVAAFKLVPVAVSERMDPIYGTKVAPRLYVQDDDQYVRYCCDEYPIVVEAH